MKQHVLFLALSAAVLGFGHPVWAQQAAPMPGMATSPQPEGEGPAAMMSGMNKMTKDMAAVPMTGDMDRDFVGMMIPHHQGAIAMARVELAHGKDPMLRKMARDIIAAQEKEIGEMKAWQAKHPAAR